VWVTAQALAALARKPFPLAVVPRAKRAAPPARPRSKARPRPAPPSAEPGTARKSTAAAGTSAAAAGTSAPQGELGPPTPTTLEPTLQANARLAGFVVGVVL